MIKSGGYRDERAELLIDLLEGALQEEGYKTIRMSETSNYCTTSYDALIVKDWKFGGGIFTISIDNCRNECFKPLFKTKDEYT